MATKIVLKHGTGIPSASDLEVGEVGLDLTNNTLYTKNGLGNVVQLGGSSGAATQLTGATSSTSRTRSRRRRTTTPRTRSPDLTLRCQTSAPSWTSWSR